MARIFCQNAGHAIALPRSRDKERRTLQCCPPTAFSGFRARTNWMRHLPLLRLVQTAPLAVRFGETSFALAFVHVIVLMAMRLGPGPFSLSPIAAVLMIIRLYGENALSQWRTCRNKNSSFLPMGNSTNAGYPLNKLSKRSRASSWTAAANM